MSDPISLVRWERRRRVRDVLHRQGLEQLWYDFEAEADRELALDWLRSHGLIPDETDEDASG